jgi:hypothetical protein
MDTCKAKEFIIEACKSVSNLNLFFTNLRKECFLILWHPFWNSLDISFYNNLKDTIMKRFAIIFSLIAGTIIFCSVNVQAQQRSNGYPPNGYNNNGNYNNGNYNNNNNWNNQGGNCGNRGGYNNCSYGNHQNGHVGCGYNYNQGYTEIVIVRPSYPRHHWRRW